jgi:hypothetical protein
MLSLFRALFGNSNASTFNKVSKQKTLRRQNMSSQTNNLLCAGNLRGAVKLPDGEDANEWIAANCTLGCGSEFTFPSILPRLVV